MYVEDVVFGLLDTTRRIGDTKLAEKLRNFTLAWSRYGYRGDILENRSLDQLLQEAYRLGYSYCFVQSYGHIISENWFPKHWKRLDFQSALRQWVESRDFLVTGRIFEGRDGWCGLSDESLLVNLDNYARLGYPEFGSPQPDPVEMVRPSRKTNGNRGDGWIESVTSSGEIEEAMPRHAGWGFIDASLRNRLPVYNFDQSLDGNRLTLSSDSQSMMETFSGYLDMGLWDYSRGSHDSRLSSDQRKFLDTIDWQVKQCTNGVFLLNLESYLDVLEPPSEFEPPLTTLYSVASGFKPNMILHSLGFDEATRVVFFDYSAIALEIRKVIDSEWDGEDYPRFVRYLMQKFPPSEVFYHLWAEITPDEMDWADMNRLWADEIEKWGGESVIKDHWSRYRALRREYVHCNILTEQDRLLATMRNQPNSAIWWSNAFFTVYSNWMHTADERKRIYDNWLERLVERNPGIFLYGSDYNNININHICARKYMDHYSVEGRNYLKPCKLFKHEVRL